MTSAEYPAAILIPAHPTNYHADARRPEFMVIHETDGRGVAMNTARMWQEPHHRSSAHFVVGQDGVVIQSVMIKDIAYHAHSRGNRLGIGIEHCARAKGEWDEQDPGLPLSQVQLAASVRLAAWLCFHCGIVPTRSTIVGHCEIDDVTTHRKCPVAVFDLDAYAAAVQGEYAGLRSGAGAI